MVSIKSWRALGTSVHVITTHPKGLEPAAAAVEKLLTRVDLTCSRFRPDSELTYLNSHAGESVQVSWLLSMAIGVAMRAARMTNGAVDPTVGKALRLAGYDRDFSRGPLGPAPEGEGKGVTPLVLTVEAVPGWQMVRLDPLSRSVFLPEGVELDLGSTGKALAADIAASAARNAAGAGGVLVSLGGDISTAGTPPLGGWHVLVADDSETPPDGEGENIAITRGALATSSTTVRRWTRDGVALHHIIDPQTGLPARSPWRTVTVAASNCVDANMAATAAIVDGEGAIEWLSARGLPARLVANDGTVRTAGRWQVPKKAAA